MKIKFGKDSKYGEPIPKETALKILIGIVVLSAAVLVLNYFGIFI